MCSDQQQTFPNLCELECVGATLEHTGRCEDIPCSEEDLCEDDQACLLNLTRSSLAMCVRNGNCPTACYSRIRATCTSEDQSCPRGTLCLLPSDGNSESENEVRTGFCAKTCGPMHMMNNPQTPNDSPSEISMTGSCPIESPYCDPERRVCLSLCSRSLDQCHDGGVCTPLDRRPNQWMGICLP